MSLRMSDGTVFDGLAIVMLDGYETKPEMVEVTESDGMTYVMPDPTQPPDLIGSANWFCEQYGMSDEELEGPGILWTDYDFGQPWGFSVLVPADEVDAVLRQAAEAEYDLVRVEPVEEPTRYGDGSGTVAICKHPDGWVVIQN
jgi:hypothetical protein